MMWDLTEIYLWWNKHHQEVDKEDSHAPGVLSSPYFYDILCRSLRHFMTMWNIAQGRCQQHGPIRFGQLSCTFNIARNFAHLCAHSTDKKHLLQVILKSAAEIALSDTAYDNNRKRNVYCALSSPFILARKLQRCQGCHRFTQQGRKPCLCRQGGRQQEGWLLS